MVNYKMRNHSCPKEDSTVFVNLFVVMFILLIFEINAHVFFVILPLNFWQQ